MERIQLKLDPEYLEAVVPWTPPGIARQQVLCDLLAGADVDFVLRGEGEIYVRVVDLPFIQGLFDETALTIQRCMEETGKYPWE